MTLEKKVYHPGIVRSLKKELGVFYDIEKDEFYYVIPESGETTLSTLLIFFQAVEHFISLFAKIDEAEKKAPKNDGKFSPGEFN